MVSIFSRLLCYDKMDWRSINVPANAFGGMEAADQSADITVLDQSYFVFDTVRPNVINSRPVI